MLGCCFYNIDSLSYKLVIYDYNLAYIEAIVLS